MPGVSHDLVGRRGVVGERALSTSCAFAPQPTSGARRCSRSIRVASAGSPKTAVNILLLTRRWIVGQVHAGVDRKSAQALRTLRGRWQGPPGKGRARRPGVPSPARSGPSRVAGGTLPGPGRPPRAPSARSSPARPASAVEPLFAFRNQGSVRPTKRKELPAVRGSAAPRRPPWNRTLSGSARSRSMATRWWRVAAKEGDEPRVQPGEGRWRACRRRRRASRGRAGPGARRKRAPFSGAVARASARPRQIFGDHPVRGA